MAKKTPPTPAPTPAPHPHRPHTSPYKSCLASCVGRSCRHPMTSVWRRPGPGRVCRRPGGPSTWCLGAAVTCVSVCKWLAASSAQSACFSGFDGEWLLIVGHGVCGVPPPQSSHLSLVVVRSLHCDLMDCKWRWHVQVIGPTTCLLSYDMSVLVYVLAMQIACPHDVEQVDSLCCLMD